MSTVVQEKRVVTCSRFQCFDCGGIFTSEQWNEETQREYPANNARLPECYVPNLHTIETVGQTDSDANLPAFVCPGCSAKPMADELIVIPDGELVYIRLVGIAEGVSKELKDFNYEIYLADLQTPAYDRMYFHCYADWLFSPPFETSEAIHNAINSKTVLTFLREKHSQVLPYVENKGLFIGHIWYPWEVLFGGGK